MTTGLLHLTKMEGEMVTTCPKCGVEQEKSLECVSCGIIFDKIRPNIPPPAAVDVKDRFSIRKITDWLNAIEKEWSAVKGRVAGKIGTGLISAAQSAYRTVRLWLRDVLDRILTVLVCGAVAWVAGIFLLSAAEGMWHLYLETEVGKQYFVHFPSRVQMLQRIINYPSAFFSLSVCLIVVKACLAVAAAARVSFIARGYYEHRPVFFKIIVWVPVCAAAAGWLLKEEFAFTFHISLVLAVVPALAMFIPCFELASKCVPEANLILVFRQIRDLTQLAWRKTAHYIAGQQDTDGP